MEPWEVMDLFATEWFTDMLSVLLGYIAFCVAFVTLEFPAYVLARIFKKKITVVTALVFSVFGFIALIFVTLKMHDLFDAYRIWYTTPLGPPLDYNSL